MSSGLGLERRFKNFCRVIGVGIEESPGVHCDKPVFNEDGEQVKDCVALDVLVKHPKNSRFDKLVEVSRGGFSRHKLAQLRVLKKAGVKEDEHIKIRHTDMRDLEEIDDGKKRKLFRRKMGWKKVTW